jgi:hypothetical protein
MRAVAASGGFLNTDGEVDDLEIRSIPNATKVERIKHKNFVPSW